MASKKSLNGGRVLARDRGHSHCHDHGGSDQTFSWMGAVIVVLVKT